MKSYYTPLGTAIFTLHKTLKKKVEEYKNLRHFTLHQTLVPGSHLQVQAPMTSHLFSSSTRTWSQSIWELSQQLPQPCDSSFDSDIVWRFFDTRKKKVSSSNSSRSDQRAMVSRAIQNRDWRGSEFEREKRDSEASSAFLASIFCLFFSSTTLYIHVGEACYTLFPRRRVSVLRIKVTSLQKLPTKVRQCVTTIIYHSYRTEMRWLDE